MSLYSIILYHVIFTLLNFADTVSTVYSDAWAGVSQPEQNNAFIQLMASNNLIFVVLGVVLIIWFVLLAYLVRLEKKINRLEEKITK